MLRVSNVLNKYFKQKKILRYFSLPHGEYIIEYKKRWWNKNLQDRI